MKTINNQLDVMSPPDKFELNSIGVCRVVKTKIMMNHFLPIKNMNNGSERSLALHCRERERTFNISISSDV
jgi:hypothetical protein